MDSHDSTQNDDRFNKRDTPTSTSDPVLVGTSAASMHPKQRAKHYSQSETTSRPPIDVSSLLSKNPPISSRELPYNFGVLPRGHTTYKVRQDC